MFRSVSAATALLIILVSMARAEDPVPTHPPLPYRSISFHRGMADLELIERAKAAGYNWVQIQTEDGTVKPIEQFAAYNRQTGLIARCHQLGMQVSLWVHELNDIPDEFLKKPDQTPLQPGEVLAKYRFAGDQQVVIKVDDPKLWELLTKRYERFLTELIPEVDALVLTVTETQVHGTNPALFKPLVTLLDTICKRHGKRLHVRTFVWHPEDLVALVDTIKQLPEDVVVMSKCVPQDWHLRGIDSTELGVFGHHEQIEEWDVEGEYFGLNKLVNCMPALLQRQFEHGLAKGIDGICVRVDRGSSSVKDQPSEVNMWTLGQLATGTATTVDQVWKRWATQRYGEQAGAAVIPALKQSTDVVQEILYCDRFSFFDSRSTPGSPGDADAFRHLSNPHLWAVEFKPLHQRLLAGDAQECARIQKDKAAAALLAQQALTALESAKPLLWAGDYQQLRRGLLTNQVQLAWRAPMQLSYLNYRRFLTTTDPAERKRLANTIRTHLDTMHAVLAQADPLAVTDSAKAEKWIGEMLALLK
jgi:hypothetical protein